MKNFSVEYCFGSQVNFSRALSVRNLEKAESILLHIPSASTLTEGIEKTILLAEGYQMLFRAAQEMIASPQEAVQSQAHTLQAYQQLGDLITVQRNYQELRRLIEENRTMHAELELYRSTPKEDFRVKLIKAESELENVSERLQTQVDQGQELSAYCELGTAEYLQQSLSVLKNYQKLSSLEDLQKNKALLSALEQKLIALGTPMTDIDSVEKRLQELITYRGLGTVVDVENSLDNLKEYQDLGCVDELSSLIEEVNILQIKVDRALF